MENKKKVKAYLKKYFEAQYLDEQSHEFKALVRILNKSERKGYVEGFRDCSYDKDPKFLYE